MLKSPYKRFFHTLGNTTRLEIIQALRDKELNVNELITKLSYQQSTISHNLNRLAKCHFVHVKRQGQHRYYSLNRKTIVPLLKIIDKHVAAYCVKTDGGCNCHDD